MTFFMSSSAHFHSFFLRHHKCFCHFFFTLLIGYFFTFEAYAAELAIIETKDNCPVAGTFVDVNPTTAVLLKFNGEQQTILREKITAIHQYRSVSNPFRTFELGEVKMYEIALNGTTESFFAFPVYFAGELIFLLDQTGRTRVVDREEIDIIQFETLATKPLQNQIQKVYGVLELNFISLNTLQNDCSNSFTNQKNDDADIGSTEKVAPYRYLGDPLAVAEFLADLERGYTDLKKFAERSQFYARPLVFFEKSRLSLRFPFNLARYGAKPRSTGEKNIADLFPLSFEKGGGTPFGYQGYIRAGSANFRGLPSMDPYFGLETRFKAHALRGIFVGNLDALQSGSAAFLQNGSAISDYPKRPWQRFSFNYMTGFGFDYRNWTFGATTLFAVYAFGAKDETREVLARAASPGIQLGFSTRSWDLELFGFLTTLDESVQEKSRFEGLNLEENLQSSDSLVFFSKTSQPTKFTFQAKSLRANLIYSLSAESKIGGSVASKVARYEENALSKAKNAKNAVPIFNQMDYWDLAPMIWSRTDFGEWLALGGELSYRFVRYRGKYGDQKIEGNDGEPGLVFLFEVLL